MQSVPVALVECRTYDGSEIEDSIARAVELLGGWRNLLPGAGKILVKPNLLGPRRRETRACTDPQLVRALVQGAAAEGREVLVGDSPTLGTAKKAANACGLVDALEGTQARLIEFSEAEPAGSEVFPALAVAREVVRAGSVVNAAKAKTHPLMTLTLAAKNLFGCVVGLAKPQWHLKAGRDRHAFARMLVEVARCVSARLHVVEAVIAMEGNGPGNGTPRPLGWLAASTHPIALDRVACRLLGVPEREVPIFAEAEKLEWDAAPELLGDDPGGLAVSDFELARPSTPPRLLYSFFRNRLTPRPVVEGSLCKLCMACADVCPAKAIAKRRGRIRIDYSNCIRCFSCQEVCAEGAISAREGWLSRTLFGRRRRAGSG